MPQTEVVFYAEADGQCPLLAWLDSQPSKVQDKCIVRIERLEEVGHELRRPEADILRDGIYELRVSHLGVQYRILYFFCLGRAILTHGIVKERQVPDIEIQRARKKNSLRNQTRSPHLPRTRTLNDATVSQGERP